jgi:hypothetical protein
MTAAETIVIRKMVRRGDQPPRCSVREGRQPMRAMLRPALAISSALALGAPLSCRSLPEGVRTDPAVRVQSAPRPSWDDMVAENSSRLIAEGKRIFRMDSFGSEAFWGDQLQLHKAILGERKGGVGPGLTPRQALQLGLKADVGVVPELLLEVLQEDAVSFDDPDTTLALLRADAVVGVKGVFDEKDNLVSVGITCALCHSTVDDSLLKGIGRPLDGWPNRDLNVGAVVTLAPNLEPLERVLGVDRAQVEKALRAWGPGRYDAELNLDGKAFRPDGKTAATLIPAAFGLAGQNLHTYAGWGAIPYWNAYVANTQMWGKGTFVDPRLADRKKYPAAARAGFADKRDEPDLITAKLEALHYYQVSIPTPRPPEDSYDKEAARRGEAVFAGTARCASCHVPPLYSEPGWPMHTGAEIGIDDFQAARSPDRRYRTTPLRGLFARSKGGFYHDGRFPDLSAVVGHYERAQKFTLTGAERADLIEFLKSL